MQTHPHMWAWSDQHNPAEYKVPIKINAPKASGKLINFCAPLSNNIMILVKWLIIIRHWSWGILETQQLGPWTVIPGWGYSEGVTNY